jgi:hypothetical protein
MAALCVRRNEDIPLRHSVDDGGLRRNLCTFRDRVSGLDIPMDPLVGVDLRIRRLLRQRRRSFPADLSKLACSWGGDCIVDGTLFCAVLGWFFHDVCHQISMTSPNKKADAPNAAMALSIQLRRHWRGIGEPPWPGFSHRMSHQRFYEIVAEGLQRRSIRPGHRTRSVAQSGGEGDGARALYIRLRVAELPEWPNKPAPNRRPRFPLGRPGEFDHHLDTPRGSWAAVSEAQR